MKLLHFFIAALLTACSSQIQSTDSATDPAIGEAVTTTVRSFEYMPSPSLLIFSETRDWRHEEGIAGGNLAIIKAAQKMNYGYFSTEHSGVFNDKDLERFDVIVFNNMTGDSLSADEKTAFEKWLAKGNGTVLIHGAGDSTHQDWDLYQNELLGAVFVSHPMAPQIQEARVEVLDDAHPVMEGVPSEFTLADEWYTFEAPPSDDFMVLAGLDESTYSPVNTVYGDRSDLRMGPKAQDHPIIWARCYGEQQSRSVFTAMGHSYETYEAEQALIILKNALNWTAKITDPQSQGCAR